MIEDKGFLERLAVTEMQPLFMLLVIPVRCEKSPLQQENKK